MKPSKSSNKKTSVTSALGQSLSNTSGAVLLTVVIIIIIIGLAGVAIYSMTYTSTFTQLQSQNATKAYYIAESGVRVVAAEYNNASDKNDVLENQLHGKTLTLPDPAGQFDVRVYPYWFYVSSVYNANDPSIQVKMPGGIPLLNPEDPTSPRISIPGSGQVKLQGKTLLATYTTTDTSPSDGDIITLAFPDADKRFPYKIDPGEEIFLVYKDSNTGNQTNVDVGNSIDLYGNNDVAQILPAENGSFRIYNEINDKMDYSYKERIIGSGTPPAFIRLAGIDSQNSNNASVFPFSIDSNSELYFGKNLAVFSTSSFGQGNMVAKKTVGNYTDVGLDGGFSKGKDTISFEKDIADFSPTMYDSDPDSGTPIEIINTTEEKVIKLGGGQLNSYGSVWYKGDSDIANCIQGDCLLGRGIRAYFEFEFDGIDEHDESHDFGDGFSFSLVSGSNYMDGDTGAGGEYLGYAGAGLSSNGLRPPKMAVEIDTYPNPGVGNVCGSDSRRDDGDANHAALVYWGEENIGSFDAVSTSYLKADGGGYLRIGSASPINGSDEDWSSPRGTISFWFKRDTLRSTDRFWGQNADMEMRLSGGDLVLDWGGVSFSTSSFGGNPFDTSGIWYFIAITWDESNTELRLYYGDETTSPYLYAWSNSWGGTVSSVGVRRNLFMNSSGGSPIGNENYIMNGKGTDLRYYDEQRQTWQIQTDYNHRLEGNELDLKAYFPLQTDLLDIGPAGITVTAMGTTGWSADNPSAFDCGVGMASYDDNRHGAGGTTTPQNSLNSETGNGFDGYHQVTKVPIDPNWLEDGALHKLRMELIRPLTLADDGKDDTVYDYQIKVWIDCATCVSEADIAQFKDVRANYSASLPQIEKTINRSSSLEIDPADHDNLKRILFGFTQGTGGATQNITLSNFQLYFLRNYPVSDLEDWGSGPP